LLPRGSCKVNKRAALSHAFRRRSADEIHLKKGNEINLGKKWRKMLMNFAPYSKRIETFRKNEAIKNDTRRK